MTKENKWFGVCNICKRENKLMTVAISTDIGIRYWIKRSCDKCIYIIRQSIDQGIEIAQK